MEREICSGECQPTTNHQTRWPARGVAGGREGKPYRLNDGASNGIVGRARLHSTGPKAAAILSKAVPNLGRGSDGDDGHGDVRIGTKAGLVAIKNGGGISNAVSAREGRVGGGCLVLVVFPGGMVGPRLGRWAGGGAAKDARMCNNG